MKFSPAQKKRIGVRVAVFLLLCALAASFRIQDPPHLDVPYVETPPSVVQAMIDLAELEPGDRACDLGSGDGRIPLAIGARGFNAVGYELDPALVTESREKARALGLEDKVEFVEKDLFDADLTGFNATFLFLSPALNRELKPKLLREMPSGSRVVSHIFPIDGWEPDKEIVVESRRIFMWKIP
jgi:hypothetical protein